MPERRTCEFCGRDVSASNYARHVREMHTDPEETAVADEETAGSVDVAPTPRKRGRPKGSGTKATPAGIPLKVQLELPYKLLADVSATRMPATSVALRNQAPACAAAWDQFLLRYPSVRETLEKGMIAGDILGLIMAHLPIIEAMRMEVAANQARAQAEMYGDGIDGFAAA